MNDEEIRVVYNEKYLRTWRVTARKMDVLSIF